MFVVTLFYFYPRAPQLKHLRLVRCYSISDKGLSEAAKKLPLLEELHIYFGSVSKEALETVGHCCPQLKSLEFSMEDDEEEALTIAANMPNNLGFGGPYMDPDAAALAIIFQEAQAFATMTNNLGSRGPRMERDDEALAIAATMPGLRHLQLFGNKMTNKGLQAILDGCPHLQSLDIRKCFNVHLGGSLGKRCSEQIKDLRLPDDSTDGFGFDATFHDWYGYDSFDDAYPSWFSGIDVLSDINEYYEFSGGSELSEYEEVDFDD